MTGELKPFDWNDLSLDVLAIDQNSLVSDHIDNGGELALRRSVSNSGDAADLDESVVSLNQ